MSMELEKGQRVFAVVAATTARFQRAVLGM